MRSTTGNAAQIMPQAWLTRLEDKQVHEEVRLKSEKVKLQNRRRRIVLTVAMLYSLAVIFTFGNQYFQMQKIQRDMRLVQAQITEMQNKNKQLKSEVGLLNTNSYVERIAREKLGLVKPGETVLLPAQVNLKLAPVTNDPSSKDNKDLYD